MLTVPQCSASRQAESWLWPSVCGIRIFSAQSSAPRRAAVTSRLGCCQVRFRAPTLSRALRSRSSSRTRRGGQTHYAMPVPMLSSMSERGRTVARSGEKSSRSWWRGHSAADAPRFSHPRPDPTTRLFGQVDRSVHLECSGDARGSCIRLSTADRHFVFAFGDDGRAQLCYHAQVAALQRELYFLVRA